MLLLLVRRQTFPLFPHLGGSYVNIPRGKTKDNVGRDVAELHIPLVWSSATVLVFLPELLTPRELWGGRHWGGKSSSWRVVMHPNDNRGREPIRLKLTGEETHLNLLTLMVKKREKEAETWQDERLCSLAVQKRGGVVTIERQNRSSGQRSAWRLG